VPIFNIKKNVVTVTLFLWVLQIIRDKSTVKSPVYRKFKHLEDRSI
jgi:hypothetical protein